MNWTNEQRKTVIFLLVDPFHRELEWILPVIAEFQDAGYRVELFFRVARKIETGMYTFFVQLAETIADRVIWLDDLDPLPKKLVQYLYVWDKKPNRLSAAVHHLLRIGNFFGLSRWRNQVMQKFVEAWLNREDVLVLFACHQGPLEKPMPLDELPLWRFTLEMAKRQKIPHVGYPISIMGQAPKGDYLMPYSLLLVDFQEQIHWLSSTHSEPIKWLGSPQFDSSWIDRCVQAYEKYDPAVAKSLPKDRKSILVILKNDNSIFWNEWDFDETLTSMLEQLLATDDFLVLKPHPLQNMERLQRLLARFPKDRYTISFAPLLYWARKADRSISLFSSGVLYPLVFGKVTYLYWPFEDSYLDDVRSGKIQTDFIKFDEQGQMQTPFSNFTIVIPEKTLKLNDVDPSPYVERFNQIFQPEGSARRIREMCEREFANRPTSGIPERPSGSRTTELLN